MASSFPDAGAHHRYRLFGLEIASAVLLPELKAGNPAAPADLIIDYGAIPTTDADASQTLTIDDVARYWVRDGQTMIASSTSPCRTQRAPMPPFRSLPSICSIGVPH